MNGIAATVDKHDLACGRGQGRPTPAPAASPQFVTAYAFSPPWQPSTRLEPWPAARSLKYVGDGIECHALQVIGIVMSISNAGHDPDGHDRAQRHVVEVTTVDSVLDIVPRRLKHPRHEVERLGVVALSGKGHGTT